MKLTKSLIALTSAVAISASPLFAGTKTFKETVVVEEEPTPWYSASLSTGYDSLYMFRGVNVLRNEAATEMASGQLRLASLGTLPKMISSPLVGGWLSVSETPMDTAN